MKVIGISGKAGTGKSTLTKHLLELLGDGWKRVGFADVLKAEVALIFGFPVEWCYTSKENLVDVRHEKAPCYKMSVRRLLQWWGTDIRRKEDVGYWCWKMLGTLDEMDCEGVLIDDIRFENEVQLVKEQGGVSIRLVPYENYTFVEGEEAAHSSETALDSYQEWDHILAPEYGQLEQAAKELYAKICQA